MLSSKLAHEIAALAAQGAPIPKPLAAAYERETSPILAALVKSRYYYLLRIRKLQRAWWKRERYLKRVKKETAIEQEILAVSNKISAAKKALAVVEAQLSSLCKKD